MWQVTCVSQRLQLPFPHTLRMFSGQRETRMHLRDSVWLSQSGLCWLLFSLTPFSLGQDLGDPPPPTPTNIPIAGISLACGWGFHKIECFCASAGQGQRSQMTGWPASHTPGSSGFKSEMWCFVCLSIPGRTETTWGASQGTFIIVTVASFWTQWLQNQHPTDRGTQLTTGTVEARLCRRQI